MALGRPPDDGVDPRNTLPCQTDQQLIANPNIQHLPAGHRANVNPLHAFIIQPLGLKLGHHVESAAAAGTETDRPYLHHPRCRRIFPGCQPLALSGRPDSSRRLASFAHNHTVADEGQRRAIPALAPLRHLLDARHRMGILSAVLNPACASQLLTMAHIGRTVWPGPDKNVQLTERSRRVGSHHQPGDFRPRIHPPACCWTWPSRRRKSSPCSTLSASSPVITFASAGICRARAVHASPRRPSPRLMA